jgi:hypothetical protein
MPNSFGWMRRQRYYSKNPFKNKNKKKLCKGGVQNESANQSVYPDILIIIPMFAKAVIFSLIPFFQLLVVAQKIL